MTIFILSFLIGSLSGIFTGFMGGGAGMITVPLLLLIGLPPYAAVATPKVGAVGVAIGSMLKFWGTSYIKWGYTPILIVVAIFSALFGSSILLRTPEHVISNIVVILLVVSVVALHAKKDTGIVEVTTSRIKKFFGYVGFFFTEALRAAFGSGFGVITGIVLIYFFGFTMLESAATKRVSGVIVSIIALLVYLSKGIVDIYSGLGLFVGMTIGSYIGAHYSIRVGDRWLRTIFTVFALTMAAALLVTPNPSFF